MTHDNTMSLTTRQETPLEPFLRPNPIIADEITWVVDTGKPNLDAVLTSKHDDIP